MTSVVLRGLHPQPLAGYLSALGVLRIVALQHEPSARGAFEPEGFRMTGIGEEDLIELLLERYAPSPVLTPWNNASGFYDSAKGRLAAAAMDMLVASTEPRFATLVDAISRVRERIAAEGFVEAPDDETKARFIASLRGDLSDESVAWLDAVSMADEAGARMMPLLGSGGNEGVLDYSGLFLRSLVTTLLEDRDRSLRLLKAHLSGTLTSDLEASPAGQFSPGSAGGFNTGPTFETKLMPNNAWAFVLLIEGSIVWASAMASRQQGTTSRYRFAVSPFTVSHVAAGYGSAGRSDDDPQRVRAEVWLPVWQRPSTLREIAALISEGRVEVRSRDRSVRRAENGIDFAEAVSSLGVDRGVGAFARYAFIKRRGDAFLALPAGLIEVAHRPEVDLVRQLDPGLSRLDAFLRRFPGDGPPAQLSSARRALDGARFDAVIRGGPDAMRRLMRAVGRIEAILARRDPGKEPKFTRPLGGLSPDWIAACGDSVEVRLAAAIASLAPAGGVGPVRAYLAPLDPDDVKRYASAPRALAWSGRDLSDRLANVLHRRSLDVRSTADRDARSPMWGACPASLGDIADFIAGDIDEREIEELVFGLTWVRYDQPMRPSRSRDDAAPLPRDYALLKLLFLPIAITVDKQRIRLVSNPAVIELLRSGRILAALDVARRQLVAAGLRPRRVGFDGTDEVAHGRRLAAALLIPNFEERVLRERALLPTDQDRTTH